LEYQTKLARGSNRLIFLDLNFTQKKTLCDSEKTLRYSAVKKTDCQTI